YAFHFHSFVAATRARGVFLVQVGGGQNTLPALVTHVEGADLVAVRIAQIGAVRLVGRRRARPRRAFVGAAVGEADFVPALDGLVIRRGEAEGVAVRHRCLLPVIWRGDDEGALSPGIDQPPGFD